MFGPWNIWRPDRLSSLFNETSEDQVANARGPLPEDGMLLQKNILDLKKYLRNVLIFNRCAITFTSRFDKVPYVR